MKPLITILKALSDETRLRILDLLVTQALCGKALAQRLGVSEAAVSQHLKVLKGAELVAGERRGYWIHYSLNGKAVEETIRRLERWAGPAVGTEGLCHRVEAMTRGCAGEEVKAMCQCCCERPEKLKGKPEQCTPEQIKECHGESGNHPCVGKNEQTQ